MQIEQLSVFDLPQIVDYNDRLEHGRIYCKIDTLTFMFKDCTINMILRWLKLNDSVGEFLQSMYSQNSGMVPKFIFSCFDIRIEAAQIGFYNVDRSIPMFDVLCPEIRLYLGGSALDYLRSIGVDFYDYRFVQPDLGSIGTYHCTRCDWAFDFVDYKPEFLDTLIDYVQNNSLPSGRVPVANTAFGYTLRLGSSEKTLYIGSPTSDKVLRCYDKRMQLYNVDTGLWSQAPYGDCDSWFRLEWQLRNSSAHKTLFSKDPDTGEVNSFITMLKQIFAVYSFSDPTHDNSHNGSRPVVDFWQKFLPWEEISSKIIQNAKYVQPTNRVTKVTNFIEHSALRSIILYLLIYGKEGLVRKCEEYLRSFDFEKDIFDPTSANRRSVFLSMVEEIYEITGIKLPMFNDHNGPYIDSGRIHLSL